MDLNNIFPRSATGKAVADDYCKLLKSDFENIEEELIKLVVKDSYVVAELIRRRVNSLFNWALLKKHKPLVMQVRYAGAFSISVQYDKSEGISKYAKSFPLVSARKQRDFFWAYDSSNPHADEMREMLKQAVGMWLVDFYKFEMVDEESANVYWRINLWPYEAYVKGHARKVAREVSMFVCAFSYQKDTDKVEYDTNRGVITVYKKDGQIYEKDILSYYIKKAPRSLRNTCFFTNEVHNYLNSFLPRSLVFNLDENGDK